jgi:large subunit ribosomal protein L19
MIQCKEIQELEAKQLKSNIPTFGVGDTIDIHLRIVEGEKERTQVFTGTVIARRGGGLSETVALYQVRKLR